MPPKLTIDEKIVRMEAELKKRITQKKRKKLEKALKQLMAKRNNGLMNSHIKQETKDIIDNTELSKYRDQIKKYNLILERLEVDRHRATSRKQFDHNNLQHQFIEDRIDFFIDQYKKGVPFFIALKNLVNNDSDPNIEHPGFETFIREGFPDEFRKHVRFAHGNQLPLDVDRYYSLGEDDSDEDNQSTRTLLTHLSDDDSHHERKHASSDSDEPVRRKRITTKSTSSPFRLLGLLRHASHDQLYVDTTNQ